MKKTLIIIAAGIVLIIAVAGLWMWSSSMGSKDAVATPVNADIIFFYGQECPHCQEVEKFIADNKIADKVKFDSLEVWHNDANKNVFLQKVKECGIAEDQAGVPFLYAKGKCIIGTPDVETFFKQEAGIQ